MKYMILLYGSQQDYDAMAGQASDRPAWSAQEFAAMGGFMETFNKALVDSGELVETRGLTAPVHARRVQVHDEAPSMEATDWPQIVALYGVLLQVLSNPVVELNHAVAVGMAQGPQAGLRLIDKLETDARLAQDYRLHAVRAHLQEMAGDRLRARDSYVVAAQRAPNLAQQRYLHARAERLTG